VLADALLDVQLRGVEDVQLRSAAPNSYNWVSRSILATQALYRICVSRRYIEKGRVTHNKPMPNKMQTMNFCRVGKFMAQRRGIGATQRMISVAMLNPA
jgi:hypothetical protein